MKTKLTLTLLLTALFSMSAFAKVSKEGPKPTFSCSSDSDPDYIDVDIYAVKERTFAVIQQYYGDGDSYAEDVIEVGRIESWDGQIMYVQISNDHPKSKAAPKATGKTVGAVLITNKDESKLSAIHAVVGPNGSQMGDESLMCTRL